MVKKGKIRLNFLVLLGLLALAACGDRSEDPDIQQEQSQRQEGSFSAPLIPVGTETAQGEANFEVGDESFAAKVFLTGLSPQASYHQYLLRGNTCPSIEQDQDDDGAITLSEASAVTDLVLIPLDNDLSSQGAGGAFPMPEADGGYDYQAGASLEDLINDLREPDTEDSDLITKLVQDERLNMEGRTVMVTRVEGDQEAVVSCGVVLRD